MTLLSCTLQDALRALEMPRFTRRYPAILETLMKQMLNMVHVSSMCCGHMSHVSRHQDRGYIRACCSRLSLLKALSRCLFSEQGDVCQAVGQGL
jgi:hypothetical protein